MANKEELFLFVKSCDKDGSKEDEWLQEVVDCLKAEGNEKPADLVGATYAMWEHRKRS